MQPTQAQDFTQAGEVLAVSLELAVKGWKVGLHDGRREKPVVRRVASEVAGQRLAEAVKVMEETKKRWQLGPGCRVVVVYEAGQDGFWIKRALEQQGYEVWVVDPASIPVARRARRAKTDRLDAIKLVLSLLGWLRGERDRMHVVRVPALEVEARRHWVRDRGQLQKEIGQHRDRLRKLLRTLGCWESVEGEFAQRLEQGRVRCYDGSSLPRELQERLRRECARLALVEQQLAAVEEALLGQLPQAVVERIEQLSRLKA